MTVNLTQTTTMKTTTAMNTNTTTTMKRFVCSLFIFGFSAFSSCDQVQDTINNLTESPKPMNVIVLTDLSSSIPKLTVDGYLASVETDIFPKLSGSDRLIVLPLDYGSEGSFRELFRADLAEYKPTEVAMNELQKAEYYRAQLENYKKDELLPELRNALGSAVADRSLYGRGTDVLGAVRTAKKYIDPRCRNLVVVFSDMIQETEVVNMESSMRSDDQVAVLLGKTDTLRLEGADIVVITGEQPSISISKFQRMKTYWEQLASRDGWNLLDYSSGSKEAMRRWLSKE
jgi:hypothetical protein